MDSLDRLKIKMDIAYGYAILNIRFDRIITTMQALNWKWQTVNGLPTAHDMKVVIDRLYNTAYDEAIKTGTQSNISSGGFAVEVNLKDLTVDISFQVEMTEGKF